MDKYGGPSIGKDAHQQQAQLERSCINRKIGRKIRRLLARSDEKSVTWSEEQSVIRSGEELATQLGYELAIHPAEESATRPTWELATRLNEKSCAQKYVFPHLAYSQQGSSNQQEVILLGTLIIISLSATVVPCLPISPHNNMHDLRSILRCALSPNQPLQ